MRSTLCDVASLVGVLAIAAGLWWIWPPLALLVGGLGALAAGILGARQLAQEAERRRHEKAPADVAQRRRPPIHVIGAPEDLDEED